MCSNPSVGHATTTTCILAATSLRLYPPVLYISNQAYTLILTSMLLHSQTDNTDSAEYTASQAFDSEYF